MITSMSTMIIATRNTATTKVATHSGLIPFFVEVGSVYDNMKPFVLISDTIPGHSEVGINFICTGKADVDLICAGIVLVLISDEKQEEDAEMKRACIIS